MSKWLPIKAEDIRLSIKAEDIFTDDDSLMFYLYQDYSGAVYAEVDKKVLLKALKSKKTPKVDFSHEDDN